jgi:hypothetical protein
LELIEVQVNKIKLKTKKLKNRICAEKFSKMGVEGQTDKTVIKIKYQLGDSGPFKVNFKLKSESDKFLDHMSIAQKLCKLRYNDVIEIKRNSKTCATVVFRTMASANNVIDDKSFEQKYNIFIPSRFVFVFGYVTGLSNDLDWSGEDGIVSELLRKNPNIIEVKRFKYKDSEGTEKFSHKTSLKFRMNLLPPTVNAYGMRKKVFPFVNKVKVCTKCGLYGHLNPQCKSTSKICPSCYSKEHEVDCKIIKCKQCKGDHVTGHESCPEMEKQKKISKIMSVNNISYHEAQKSLRNNNFYATLESHEEFPTLSNRSFFSRPQSQNSKPVSFANTLKRKNTHIVKNANEKLTPHNRASRPTTSNSQNEKIFNPLFGESFKIDFSKINKYVNEENKNTIQEKFNNFFTYHFDEFIEIIAKENEKINSSDDETMQTSKKKKIYDETNSLSLSMDTNLSE